MGRSNTEQYRGDGCEQVSRGSWVRRETRGGWMRMLALGWQVGIVWDTEESSGVPWRSRACCEWAHTECFEFNVCVVFQFICWDLIPGRWRLKMGLLGSLGHEGRALMSGISAHLRRGWRATLLFFCHERLRKEVGSLQPGRRPWTRPGIQACWCQILSFQSLALWAINVCSVSHPVYDNLL